MAVVNFNYPKFKYTIASTGQPGVGYKLFTYEEGTSTKKTTWTSLAKTAENTNPIILDANGEADVWIDGDYKFVLAPPTDTDPPTSPVWTYDAVRSQDTTASSTEGMITPTNGSFENDTDADGVPDNWTVVKYSGGTVELDTTSSTHGETSLKFTSIGNGGGSSVTNEYYEVEAGKVVGVRFSIISGDVDTLNKVQISWYNSSKVFLSTSDAYNDGATNPTTWTRKYTSITAPATAKYAKVILVGVDPLSTTHSTTSFDNITLDTGFTGEITATPSELNALDGITATVTELNTLDGITADTTELNYSTGVTSSIQTQLNTLTTNVTARTLTKILTTTVSSPVASVSFQDGVGGVVFDSTYDAYLIQLVNVVTDTDGIDLQARVYVGGVLQTGAAAYDAGGATAAQMTLASSIGNAVGEGIDSMIYIYNPAGTTRNKRVRAESVFTQTTGFPTAPTGVGEYNSTAAIDGFQLYSSSGNISNGIFRLYGVSY